MGVMEAGNRFGRAGIVWAVVFFSMGSLFWQNLAFAAPLKGYEAVPVTISGSGKLTLRPGESKEVTASFQNIGTKTWSREGTGFVSVYT